MAVSSNGGALGQLQELGGLATSRLQGLLGSSGAGLGELLGTSKITSSAQVQAIMEIGQNVVDSVIQRAAGGKELEALKEIGSFVLNKVFTTVQDVAEQMGDAGAGAGITARLQGLGDLLTSVAENTGLADGFARLAETAMGAIARNRA